MTMSCGSLNHFGNNPLPLTSISWAVLRDTGQADSNLALSHSLGEPVPLSQCPAIPWSMPGKESREGAPLSSAPLGSNHLSKHSWCPMHFCLYFPLPFVTNARYELRWLKVPWERRILFNSLTIIPGKKKKKNLFFLRRLQGPSTRGV